MWMDSYLLDSLIREELAAARDRAARHQLLHSVERRPRARRHGWVESLKAFVSGAASAIERGPRTTAAGGAIAPHAVFSTNDVGWLRRLRVDQLFMTLITAAVLATGCQSSATTEFPSTSGRRVQGASMVAEGSVPVRLGAYELLFANTPSTPWQARRAALLVDLAAGQGLARGFVEVGRAGEAPLIYTAGGWARQRENDGERLTVFELQLNYLGGRDTPRVALDSRHLAPIAVRVVVHEASDDVTLTRRR